MAGAVSNMRIGCEKIRRTIAYIIAAFLLVGGVMPMPAYAAGAEKQSAVTEDKILEMSSDSKSLNKGDTVDVKFAIHFLDISIMIPMCLKHSMQEIYYRLILSLKMKRIRVIGDLPIHRLQKV